MISALLPKPRSSPHSILSIDYYGNISMHSTEGVFQSSLSTTPKTVVPKCVRTAASNAEGSLIAVLSTGGNSYNGVIEVFSIDSYNHISKIRVLRGNFKQCEFANDVDLFVLRESVVYTDKVNPWRQKDLPVAPEKVLDDFESEADEVESSESLLEAMTVNSKRIVTYYACIFTDIERQRQGRAELKEIYARVNCMTQNYQGQVAFATMNRVVFVVEMESLATLHILSLAGAGSLAMIMFENKYMYFSPQEYFLCRFDITQAKVEKKIEFIEQCSEIVWVKTNQNWIHKNNFMKWVEYEKVLISLNEYGIFSAEFVNFPSDPVMINHKEECIFKITCCGLDIHATQKLVAIGDFSGNIYIFHYESDVILYNTSLPSSIRCLNFNLDSLYIGTMEGTILVWDYQVSSEPGLFFTITDGSSVICMAWKADSLAVGCTNGEIWEFLHSPENFHSFLAHDKQESDEKFGSLGLFSEVWSITWSPCGRFLASGSEDQSVKVWNASDCSLITTLPKHKRAVTGVRWERIQEISVNGNSLSEILVSCSDDETLRVYNTRTWENILEVTTSCIQEWHTITYTAIEKDGYRVACVTQNGFLFVIDLRSGGFEVVERLHNGSIEGFAWRDEIITCSSEGLACIVSLNKS